MEKTDGSCGTAEYPAALTALAEAFGSRGARLYIVGGAVRSDLLGLPRTDVDLTGALLHTDVQTLCDALSIPCVPMSTALGTLHIRIDGEVCEYTPYRAEFYARGGAHRPEQVRFGVSMAEDAARRDFTVNALYRDCLTGEIADPLGGMADLAARTLRCCRADTLESDALRILRLVRFACRLGFDVAPDAMAAARQNAPQLKDIAPERRREELCGILLCDGRGAGEQAPHDDAACDCPPLPDGESAPVLRALHLLDELGAWPYLLPDLTAGRGMAQRPDFHKYDVMEHAFHVCANTPRDLTLRLAGLLHDVGKPACFAETGNFHRHDAYGETIARRLLGALRCPNAVTAQVCALVRAHMYDIQQTAKRTTLRVRFAAWGRAKTAQLIRLREADIRGCGTDRDYVCARWRTLYAEMLRDGTPFSESELAVTGADIMAVTGLTSGAEVGRIKAELFVRCAKRPRDNTRERLLAVLSLSGERERTKEKAD